MSFVVQQGVILKKNKKTHTSGYILIRYIAFEKLHALEYLALLYTQIT